MKRAALVVLLAIVAMLGVSGARADAPTVSVSPADGVLDGQHVDVHWTNFPPSNGDELAGVSVSQCKQNASIPNADCGTSELGVSSSTGSGDVHLPIHTGTITSKDFSTTFTCDRENPCTVAVYVDPASPLGGSSAPSAVTPIAFAFPPTACPHDATAGIAGTGAEGAQRAMLHWESQICQPPKSIDLQYTRTESTEGRQAFVNGLPGADFAATSLPFTSAELSTLEAAHRKVAYAPVTASATVFTFTGSDRVTGQRLTSLVLTPSMLAHIFNGTRTSLPVESGGGAEDDELLALNPNANFFPNVQAFGRLDHAATTHDITAWFLASAAGAWKDTPPWVAERPSATGGANETADYNQPTEQLPDGLQGPGAQNQLLNGSDNLATVLTGHGAVGNNPNTTVFGYIDSSTAAFYGLPTVCIQLDPNWRTSHRSCVQATPDSISRALAAAKRETDGAVTPNWTPSDPAAYPLAGVTSVAAPQGWSDKARAATLSAFLNYAVTDGQSTLPEGYAPLPDDLRAQTTGATKTIYAPAPATPEPSASPSPTSSGTTDPVPAASGGISGAIVPPVRTGGGEGTPVTTGGSTDAAEHTSQPVPTPLQSERTLGVAGGRLSSAASWALLIALSILTCCGLFLGPAEKIRARVFGLLSWLGISNGTIDKLGARFSA